MKGRSLWRAAAIASVSIGISALTALFWFDYIYLAGRSNEPAQQAVISHSIHGKIVFITPAESRIHTMLGVTLGISGACFVLCGLRGRLI
jgi:hypothetical protein